MEMDVLLLIHNSALRGTNTSKTNRIGGGGEGEGSEGEGACL